MGWDSDSGRNEAGMQADAQAAENNAQGGGYGSGMDGGGSLDERSVGIRSQNKYSLKHATRGKSPEDMKRVADAYLEGVFSNSVSRKAKTDQYTRDRGILKGWQKKAVGHDVKKANQLLDRSEQPALTRAGMYIRDAVKNNPMTAGLAALGLMAGPAGAVLGGKVGNLIDTAPRTDPLETFGNVVTTGGMMAGVAPVAAMGQLAKFADDVPTAKGAAPVDSGWGEPGEGYADPTQLPGLMGAPAAPAIGGRRTGYGYTGYGSRGGY